MKKHLFIVLALMLSIFVSSCSTKSDKNYVIKDNMIEFDEPERAEGQKSVLQLAVDPIPVVRMGFIGLGMRGADAVNRISHIEGVEFKA
ncbi:MAG: glycosyl hydrolase, partial [Bacteroidales bacterium]|nr:glycosyl hydrolase [Bacteroidales bacterium]